MQDLLFIIFDLIEQRLRRTLRRTMYELWNMDPLKIQRGEDIVDISFVFFRRHIDAPTVGIVLRERFENERTVAVITQLCDAVQRQTSKAELDVLTIKEIIQVQIDALDVLDGYQGIFVFLDDRLQIFPDTVCVLKSLIDVFHIILHPTQIVIFIAHSDVWQIQIHITADFLESGKHLTHWVFFIHAR